MTHPPTPNPPLPLSVGDLTAEWFNAILDGTCAGVDEVDVESIVWGTATKVFVRLRYATDPGPGGPPAALCVKAGLNPQLRPLAGSGYLAEARFYAELAPALGTPLPRCWYAAADASIDQGVVVLDDLRAEASFPDMLRPVPVETVAAALEQQAGWHALTWNNAGLSAHPWLTLGSPVQRSIIQTMLGEDHWSHHLGLPRGGAMPPSLRDPQRVNAAFARLWEDDDRRVTALSHGDAHIGNLYLAPGPAFLDWQGVCRAPWSDDVTYLVGGALGVEDRRANERDLIAHYLRALTAAGAPAPNFDEAWEQYRRHHLHGLVWLLVPEAMQPEAACHAMGERYAAACVDHDVFGALGV